MWPRIKDWLGRIAAAYFLVTAVTGIVLYFRPGGGRPGLYSDETKEIVVMLHNGEWISAWLLGRPVYSGLAIGLCLAAILIRSSIRRVRR